MQFQEFTDVIREHISNITGPEFTVKTFRVLKNNSVGLTGISILKKGSNISPTIYLDDFYTDYCDGTDIEVIINDILRVYSQNRTEKPADIEFFEDFEKIRHRVVYKLISYEQNTELLGKVPHRRFVDLAVIYIVCLGSAGQGHASMTIYDDHMRMWGIDEQELWETASENTPELFSPEITSIKELIMELAGGSMEDVSADDEEDLVPMYVLSNISRMNGAACMLYDGVIRKFAEYWRTDLYIIPSSIHEVIMIPDNGSAEPERLLEMISDVNDTQVSAEEVLSYGLYHYSRSNDSLRIFTQAAGNA